MTTTQEALRLALDALDESQDEVSAAVNEAIDLWSKYPTRQHKITAMQEQLARHKAAIAAVEAALAEPKQEPDLAKQLEDALRGKAFYQRRCELLARWQYKMRDPERRLVCDILDIGQTWNDESRYAAPIPSPALVTAARAALRMVDDQAENGGLWFTAQYASEGYLQQELRRLHATVEALRKALP